MGWLIAAAPALVPAMTPPRRKTSLTAANAGVSAPFSPIRALVMRS